jgi:protocatechuate 3,4-dioxygenase beta subunit
MNRRKPAGSPHWRKGEVDRSRRLSLIALGAGAALASGRSLAQAARCVLTDNAGEGPFYFDPDLIRADVTDGSPGAPLTIAMQVTRAGDCATLSAARVDLWQANAVGLYSGYAQQPGVGGVPAESAAGETYLRGTQLTDADGWVRFRTVYPSWYGGRTPHLHFKVWLGPEEVVASQVFFPDEVSAFVFESFEPYRTHIEKRTTFNDNDPLQQGVYCEVGRHDENGVDASVVVAVQA